MDTRTKVEECLTGCDIVTTDKNLNTTDKYTQKINYLEQQEAVRTVPTA